jgi:hypothetical protein
MVALVPPLSPCRRPASPASRALRQLRQPRRTICPSLRSSSNRFRATQSRPEPVKCGVRRISAFSRSRPAPVSKGVRRYPLADELGVGPQADDPAGRPTRAPERSELLAAGRPAPADRPHRPPPTTTEATCLPAALPESSTLEPSRSPRPWAASWIAPISPPLAAPRATSSRLGRSTDEGAEVCLTVGEISKRCSGSYQDERARVSRMSYRRGPLHADRICRPPWGRQSRRSLLRIQLQRVKDVGL